MICSKYIFTYIIYNLNIYTTSPSSFTHTTPIIWYAHNHQFLQTVEIARTPVSVRFVSCGKILSHKSFKTKLQLKVHFYFTNKTKDIYILIPIGKEVKCRIKEYEEKSAWRVCLTEYI